MTVNFNSLYQCVAHFHTQMDEIFGLHQEALIARDIPLAMSFLRLFKQVITEHIALEDALLIEKHKSSVAEPQWDTLIYEQEHLKITTLLKELFQRFDQAPVSTQRHWIIKILDYERLLKNVIEQHEEREEQGLLKELDNSLAQTAQRELLTRCHLSLQQSLDNIEEDLRQLSRQLPTD